MSIRIGRAWSLFSSRLDRPREVVMPEAFRNLMDVSVNLCLISGSEAYSLATECGDNWQQLQAKMVRIHARRGAIKKITPDDHKIIADALRVSFRHFYPRTA